MVAPVGPWTGLGGLQAEVDGALDERAAAKVSPWLLARAAAGQEVEFLVVLDQQADLSGANALSTKQAKGRYVFEALRRTAEATQEPLLQWLTANQVQYRSFYIVNMVWVKGRAKVVRALAARPDVARLDANPQIVNSVDSRSAEVAATSADSVQPNLTFVHAPELWAAGYTGQGVVIGSQDTGVQWDHPALVAQYRGWNGSNASHDYNWHDSIHTGGGVCGANSPTPCDDYGHGTHTVGIAVGDDGADMKIGMAPGARWIGCRNMDRGVGTPARYLECFEFFLAPYPAGSNPAAGNPDLAPDVTNNSWACPPFEGCTIMSLQAAVAAQRAAGIMTVASAGNAGASCATVNDPPAIYDDVYTVGALLTASDDLAGFSSRGPVDDDGSNRPKPDITAPGVNIVSSVVGGGYGPLSGTSMAAPHVAGAVALLWSARPVLKNQIDLTEQALNNSAFHIASSACDSSGWPNNSYGYGRLDVLAAVNAVPADTGQLSGAALDALTHAPIVGAALSMTAVLTPTITFHGLTQTSGTYTQTLFAGTYTVTLAHAIYPGAVVSGVSVVSGTTTVLDFELTAPHYMYLPAYYRGLAGGSTANDLVRALLRWPTRHVR